MLEWHPITHGDRAGIGEVSCASTAPTHAEETLAVRIEGPGGQLATLRLGAGMVGRGARDRTGPAPVRGHVYGRARGYGRHLSARQAGSAAKVAGARRLVLTHRWPTVDAGAVVQEAEAAFGGR